jgi:hypothetical protein
MCELPHPLPHWTKKWNFFSESFKTATNPIPKKLVTACWWDLGVFRSEFSNCS